MDLKNKLNNFLDKKFSETINDDGSKNICDLETGDCQTIREKDGLIERSGENKVINRKIKVETVKGIKQLLND